MTTSRMNSRSTGSRAGLLTIVVAACAAAVLGTGGVAQAGRRRVVVLDFEGPRSEKFHDDLVRLIKKTHTVVPAEKWNDTAEQLDAGTRAERDIKKVARKLKIDAIVEGRIEKRRDEFIIRLKLHEGRSGALIGGAIDTKAEGPRIDGRAQRDLKDELIGAIDNVELNHVTGGTAGEGDDDAPAKQPKQRARAGDDGEDDGEDDDERPASKGKRLAAAGDEDDDRPAKKRFSRRVDDERGDDKVGRKGKRPDGGARPASKRAGRPDDGGGDDGDAAAPARPRRVAGRDDSDEDEVDTEADAEADTEADADAGRPLGARAALSPGERALDAVLGLSVTTRRMTFAITPTLQAKPSNYKGRPVAGAMFDATLYPLAFGHARKGPLKDLGLDVIYDRVLKLNTTDPATGAVYSTIESRFWLAAVFRHAFGDTAKAPVVLGSLGFGRQAFNILGKVDVPDVKYTMFAPGAGLRLPVTPKLILGADAKLLLVASAGQIEDRSRYGDASVLGFEGSAGVDYLITPRIFARAALRVETIGFTFQGNGTQSNARDGMPMTQDVTGARDTYFGGMATVGYLY